MLRLVSRFNSATDFCPVPNSHRVM
jgi:hypothetical protein